MRKLLYSIIILSFCFGKSVFSQVSQIKIARNSLGKLKEAIDAKADSKKQLTIIGEGIKALDLAEKDKRTKNWPETWAIKAYFTSYIALIDANETNANRQFDLANEALNNAQKLDKYQSNTELINAANYNIHAKILKDGTRDFLSTDYSSAYPLLKKVSDFLPKDTTSALNTAICALNLQQYNDALTYLIKAKDNGIRNPIAYQQLASIYNSKFEYEKAIRTLEEGIKLNPNSNFLINHFINLLLDNEQYAKATKFINENIENNQSYRLLYYLQGYLFQQNGEISKAEESYRKALTLDQNYFEAIYQLSLIFIQKSNEALKSKNKSDYNTYLNRALFFLSRAHEINNHHQKTIDLLINIYTVKNRFDKVQELKQKRNEF